MDRTLVSMVLGESHHQCALWNKVGNLMGERTDVTIHPKFGRRYEWTRSDLCSPIYHVLYANQVWDTWLVEETTFELRTTGCSPSRRISHINSVTMMSYCLQENSRGRCLWRKISSSNLNVRIGKTGMRRCVPGSLFVHKSPGSLRYWSSPSVTII